MPFDFFPINHSRIERMNELTRIIHARDASKQDFQELEIAVLDARIESASLQEKSAEKALARAKELNENVVEAMKMHSNAMDVFIEAANAFIEAANAFKVKSEAFRVSSRNGDGRFQWTFADPFIRDIEKRYSLD